MKPQKSGLLFVLIFAVSLMASLPLANANYLPPPSLEIVLPVSAPAIYSDSPVPLQVVVNVEPDAPDITRISYSIDGKAPVTLSNIDREENMWYWTSTEGVSVQGTAFRANTSMTISTEGTHTVTVYSRDSEGNEMTKSVDFTVDYSYVPPTRSTVSWPPLPSSSQTETLPPTENEGLLQLKNSLWLIVIAFIAASSVTVLFFIRKRSKLAF
ncbi:MAG: hypothetical protein NWF01_10730 [Candidatus Bathyarchaeota archaeon]|nr:hypothetical protein [Candidatus Bathyarchaeota archaeon]